MRDPCFEVMGEAIGLVVPDGMYAVPSSIPHLKWRPIHPLASSALLPPSTDPLWMDLADHLGSVAKYTCIQLPRPV